MHESAATLEYLAYPSHCAIVSAESSVTVHIRSRCTNTVNLESHSGLSSSETLDIGGVEDWAGSWTSATQYKWQHYHTQRLTGQKHIIQKRFNHNNIRVIKLTRSELVFITTVWGCHAIKHRCRVCLLGGCMIRHGERTWYCYYFIALWNGLEKEQSMH